MRTLILLFSQGILECLEKSLPPGSEALVTDKAALKKMSVLSIVRHLRSECFARVYLGCDDIIAGRNLVVYKMLLLTARAKERWLCDTNGNLRQLRRRDFFFRELPVVVIRIASSFLLVGRAYLKFAALRAGGKN